ncbi:hypothetical protein LLEC1_01519 [Akanthomyces lecanii]|uniref:Uncharacterized protein n=1 Tax=Cordyceps confragosa TaxID=2714763 RepID=A0A179I5C2_CORDF|nr:hypothetical protein LLEC1_01519 [Akanthomyces lecanii]
MSHDTDDDKYVDEDGIYRPPIYRSTLQFLRLRWQIKDGPIFQCVRVLDDPEHPASAQQPFQDERGTFHEISTAAFSDPPVKQLTLCITELDGYSNEDENLDGQQSDHEPDAPSLDITSDGHEFVTIRQYIEQVHPWLLSLKEAYFDKFGRAMTGRRLPARTQLWFDPLDVHHIAFLDSATMKPLDHAWQLPAGRASRILHGDSEDDYDDVDPEESLEDFLKRVKENEDRQD